MIRGCTFGTIIHETQYIVNYSFMVLCLYVFCSVFSVTSTQCNNTIVNSERVHKAIKKSLIVSLSIYIVSIYISIITNTSSTTYIEGIGYKGWFESGNSISAILVLSTFIVLSFIMKIRSKYSKKDCCNKSPKRN